MKMRAKTGLSRRAVLAVGCCAATGLLGAGEPKKRRIGLGFSLYGMKSVPLSEAVKTCAAIGYDCLELPVLADWPADSVTFPAAARKEFRQALADQGIKLAALMDNLPLLVDDKQVANLERLKAAAQLAHELAPDAPPLVETVLGGSPAAWEQVKEKMVERLKAWTAVMAESKVVLAIKAHVSNACHLPADLQWLLKQVDSPWLKAAYDYSHFQLQGLDLAESLESLLPQAVFIHVKDARGKAGKFQFLLPGEGKGENRIDYVEYFRQLAATGYRGDVVVEVSGQLHSQPGYDPLVAAWKSYSPLAEAFKSAGLR